MKLPNRLLPYDDAGERMDRLWGKQLGSIHVRYYDTPVDLEALRSLHSHLAKGPMNRTPKRARVPGARKRWVRPATTADLVHSAEPIPFAEVSDWVDQQAEATLDLHNGPVWRLTATAVEGGHTLVAMRFHHAVADGLTELSSWAAAAQGHDVALPDEDSGVVADLRDSARQYASAARTLVGMVRKAVRGEKRPSDPDEAVVTGADLRPSPTSPPEFLPRRAYLEFPIEQFRAAASGRGGTTNSLAVGIAAGVLVATGVVPEGSSFRVTQQVRQADAAATMGNLSTAASITVTADATLYEDLRPIRAASKQAFQDLQKNDPYRQLSILLQVLPDWIFRRLAPLMKKPSKDLCSVTNVGLPPRDAIRIGEETASVFTGWYLPPRTTSPESWRNYATQIQLGTSETADVAFLGIEGRNPEHHALSRDEFIGLLVEECARWGLKPIRAY